MPTIRGSAMKMTLTIDLGLKKSPISAFVQRTVCELSVENGTPMQSSPKTGLSRSFTFDLKPGGTKLLLTVDVPPPINLGLTALTIGQLFEVDSSGNLTGVGVIGAGGQSDIKRKLH